MGLKWSGPIVKKFRLGTEKSLLWVKSLRVPWTQTVVFEYGVLTSLQSLFPYQLGIILILVLEKWKLK